MDISDKAKEEQEIVITNLRNENEKLRNELQLYKTDTTKSESIVNIQVNRGKPKILIVDDIEDNLMVLKSLLMSVDAEIIVVNSGLKALKEVAKHDFAIMLIDVNMPDLNGFDTVKLMREIKKTEQMPVIFISAIHYERSYQIEGIKTGAVDYITKPFIPEVLLGKVNVFIDLYKKRVELEKFTEQLLISKAKRKKISIELELYKNDLERIVGERTKELENSNLQLKDEIAERCELEKKLIKSKDKAEEADKLKSAFLANMSHEIRTPMNGIMVFSELLSTKTLSDTKKEKYLNFIINNTNTLLTLIDNIIEISKIEANQIEIKKGECPLNKLLLEQLSFYEKEKKQIEKSHIKIGLHLDSQDPDFTIITDDVLLRQVLCNLIGNALKFTENGFIEFGYKIIEQCKNSQISKLKFYIKDSGIGLTKEQTKIIFDRFQQADYSTTRKYGGFGLGLAISKSIINLLGGDIWVESFPSNGSTFYFTIPFEQSLNIKQIREEKTNTVNKIEYNWLNKNILIVEDDKISSNAIQELLLETNATLIFAEDGLQAIKICNTRDDIDLVLMDIQLPGLNGYDTTRQILNRRNELPIIAQTAFVMSEDKRKCLEAGCIDFISKPLRRDKLLFTISKYLTNVECEI